MYPDCEVDIKVLGGLPVTVKVWIQSEDPEVGIFYPYIEDYILCHHKTGKPHTQWIYNRIEKDGSDKVYDAIWEALEESKRQAEMDAAEARYEDRDFYDYW